MTGQEKQTNGRKKKDKKREKENTNCLDAKGDVATKTGKKNKC